MLKCVDGQSELFVILLLSSVEGSSLSRVPLYEGTNIRYIMEGKKRLTTLYQVDGVLLDLI